MRKLILFFFLSTVILAQRTIDLPVSTSIDTLDRFTTMYKPSLPTTLYQMTFKTVANGLRGLVNNWTAKNTFTKDAFFRKRIYVADSSFVVDTTGNIVKWGKKTIAAIPLTDSTKVLFSNGKWKVGSGVDTAKAYTWTGVHNFKQDSIYLNNKLYKLPSAYLANSVLYDSLGAGTLKWKLYGGSSAFDTSKAYIITAPWSFKRYNPALTGSIDSLAIKAYGMISMRPATLATVGSKSGHLSHKLNFRASAWYNPTASEQPIDFSFQATSTSIGYYGASAKFGLYYGSAYGASDPFMEFYGNQLSQGVVNSSVSIFAPLTTPRYKLSALNTAPSSLTDTGVTGDIRVTSGYIYVCTATNTWKRTELLSSTSGVGLLTANNSWTGKNTFRDSVSFRGSTYFYGANYFDNASYLSNAWLKSSVRLGQWGEESQAVVLNVAGLNNIYIIASTSYEMDTLKNGVDNQLITLTNRTTNAAYKINLAGIANVVGFQAGVDFYLEKDQTATFKYSSTFSKWIFLGSSQVSEGSLFLSDDTFNNASTSKHGFLPKLNNSTTQFLNGQGGWATPTTTVDLTASYTWTGEHKFGYGNVFLGKAGIPGVATGVHGVLYFNNETNGYTTSLSATGTTIEDKIISLPNASGTLALTSQLTDANLSISAITTNNATTSKHGFLPQLNNSSTQFLNGQGNWATPTSGGTVTSIATTSPITGGTITTTGTIGLDLATDYDWTGGHSYSLDGGTEPVAVEISRTNSTASTTGLYVSASGGSNVNYTGIKSYTIGAGGTGGLYGGWFESYDAVGTQSSNAAIYATASGSSTNWAGYFGSGNVKVTNDLVAGKYKLGALNTAPSSSSDTGTLGEIRITADYIYVCTATNTWKRTAIATW